jgi:hypothetical protein
MAMQSDFSTFFDAYLAALRFFDLEDRPIPSHNRPQLQRYALAFWRKAEPLIRGGAGSVSQAGHDLYLTQAGHGAGFWDGGWPAYGDRLTEIVDTFPTVEAAICNGDAVICAPRLGPAYAGPLDADRADA